VQNVPQHHVFFSYALAEPVPYRQNLHRDNPPSVRWSPVTSPMESSDITLSFPSYSQTPDSLVLGRDTFYGCVLTVSYPSSKRDISSPCAALTVLPPDLD